MFQRTYCSEHKLYSLLFTHMKIRKLLVGAFLGIFTLAGVAVLPNYASAQNDEFKADWRAKTDEELSSDEMHVIWEGTGTGRSLISVIQKAINWVLGMLSLIALVLCLWGGFLMMTSGGDSKKYEKGVGILKWAGIGLAIIALSWLIVSLIFWIINGAAGDVQSNSTANEIKNP